MAKAGSTAIRRARQGSRPRRYSHSRPTLRIQAGALGTRPETKSKAPPTPIATGTSARSRFRSIQSSCFGWP